MNVFFIFQTVCGDLHSISQPTVSRIVKRVSVLVANQYPRFVKFPVGQEAIINRQLFAEIGRGRNGQVGIPGVDGAIDCVHIRLVGTPGRLHPETFRNRKVFFFAKRTGKTFH